MDRNTIVFFKEFLFGDRKLGHNELCISARLYLPSAKTSNFQTKTGKKIGDISLAMLPEVFHFDNNAPGRNGFMLIFPDIRIAAWVGSPDRQNLSLTIDLAHEQE